VYVVREGLYRFGRQTLADTGYPCADKAIKVVTVNCRSATVW